MKGNAPIHPYTYHKLRGNHTDFLETSWLTSAIDEAGFSAFPGRPLSESSKLCGSFYTVNLHLYQNCSTAAATTAGAPFQKPGRNFLYTIVLTYKL